MRTTQQFSITLPHEMAEMVRTKVESGEYASESEVIRDGLRALQMHHRRLAFATGVPLDIYAFHCYTKYSSLPSIPLAG